MPSQLVLKFRAQSESVIAGAAATAEEVARSLAEAFDPLLEEGEERIDWALVQKLAGRRLAAKASRLAEVDERLELTRTGEKEVRQERNRLVRQLRSELRSVRHMLDEKLGREISAGFFRWREVSEVRPASLAPVARETAAALRTSTLLGSANLAASGTFASPAAIAATLEAGAEALELLLESLGPQSKRQTFDIGEKSAEWREAYSARLRLQDLLYGLYRAAGKDHLAQRLRPKTRAAAPAPETEVKPQA